MRVISLNANGIRSAERKGFFKWLARQRADVLCLQETKAQEAQLEPADFHPRGFDVFYVDAQKKGYSGVAIYSRREPDRIVRGLGKGFEDMDGEGRFIQADFGKLSVISLYLPSGSSGDERQQIKFSFMKRFTERLREMRRKRRDYILCGDWNIVHKEIDIKNWKSNQKNSGCLPEERAWLDAVFGELGFVDAFRVVDQRAEQYTWWSNRGQAWAKNVGWRIDYQVVTPALAPRVRAASIYTRTRFSDHAPLTIDYDYDF
ncbi:MAG: DNA-(apurinic or apyrimidinic site) lyase [Gammaproteobacteria bacterium SG8_47]|nr:MAG: DNA-(apurinic or apyrimidinic site) lyase [Gammaproteobacteria bacterium SG8_47]